MKRILTYSFVALLFFSATMIANESESKKNMTTYLNSLERSLSEDNNGVQFWAMFHIAKLKSENPELNLDRFEWPLNRILERENSELIKVNAKMTLLYINSNELANQVKVVDIENPLLFYTQLYFEKYKEKFGVDNMNFADQLKIINQNMTALNN